MGKINEHVGKQIRMYRKVQGLTLQQLADMIHKSRASVSKYENGEIALDIETLYDISNALHVNVNQLMDYKSEIEKIEQEVVVPSGKGAFFEANRLYFYFYDGRYNRLKANNLYS